MGNFEANKQRKGKKCFYLLVLFVQSLYLGRATEAGRSPLNLFLQPRDPSPLSMIPILVDHIFITVVSATRCSKGSVP